MHNLSILDAAGIRAEYERRRRRVRERMVAHGVECLLVHAFPDICYLTGFETIAAHRSVEALIENIRPAAVAGDVTRAAPYIVDRA